MEFKYRLSFDESIAMINMVYEMVFHKNTDTGVVVYMPELYDYALRLAAIRFYGDYDLSDNNDENYETAMSLQVQDMDIDMSQFQGMETAIQEKIEMTKARISQSHKLNQLLKEQGLF